MEAPATDPAVARDAPRAAGAGPAALLEWLVPLWLLAILAGAFVLSVAGANAGNELTADRALFVATSAATLTGFAGASAETLGPVGRVVVLGLTVAGTFFSLAAGGMLLSRAVGSRHADRQILTTAALLIAGVAVVVTPLLYARAGGVVEAAQLAVGSFGNCGVMWGDSFGISGWPAQAVLLPLATVGGLGVPVLLELLDRARGRACLSRHAQAAVGLTAATYLVGVVWIAPLYLLDGHTMTRDVLVSASTASVNARSLGMSFDPVASWPRAVPWVVMALMAVGAAPGGAGGGFKVTTLAALWLGLLRATRGEAPGRGFVVAVAWVSIYMMAIFAVTLALVGTAPQVAGDRLLFLAASAVGTVGLSHDPVSLVGLPLYVLTAAMLFGRLAPLFVLWWLGRRGRAVDVGVG